MLTISNNNFSRISAHKYNKTSAGIKLNRLNKDTVSFGYIDGGPVPKDIQLYRAIGKSELDALLEGKTIEGHSYATSDPRGWAAANWHSGFGHSNKDGYFVTFKTNRDNLDIMDRRDSFADTRYSVGDYTLDDVANIRKGHNAHGELVYAENFEEAKALDIQDKTDEINRLIKLLKSYKEPSIFKRFIKSLKNPDTISDKEKLFLETFDELGSYCKEFPNLVDGLKELGLKDERNAYLLMPLLYNAGRKQDLPYVRDYLNRFLKEKLVLNEHAVKYLGTCGNNEDIPLLLEILKENKNSGYEIPFALKKLAEEKDFPLIEKTFKEADIRMQSYLIDFFKNTPKNTEIARFVLDKYKDGAVQQEILKGLQSRNQALISTCAKILETCGTKDDIKYLEPYAREKYSYANVDAVYAINKILEKSI